MTQETEKAIDTILELAGIYDIDVEVKTWLPTSIIPQRDEDDPWSESILVSQGLYWCEGYYDFRESRFVSEDGFEVTLWIPVPKLPSCESK